MNIHLIVKEVLDLLRSSIPSSVIIESHLDEDTKPVLADSTQIHQVLLNLATNAVHAMNRKGKLTVRLFTTVLDGMEHGQSGEIVPGQYTVIEISDNGCGMDEKTLSKAFEPFFTTKGVGEGTGMGLSVVLGILQSHDGDIQVESRVGKGTVIKIYLPVCGPTVSDTPNTNSRTAIYGDERILVVDDEIMLLEMVEKILIPLGYTVISISDSLDALKYMEDMSHEFDILITDQTMPGMTGIELAQEALKIRKGLPIILCTGYSRDLNPERAAAIGVKQIVMKPYSSHEISEAIRDVLESKRDK
jgi:CheY-like chemotaxis protein